MRGSCSSPTARSRSPSARRRSGKGSRPPSRRSPPTRWKCRWIASAACSTARRRCLAEGFGSYHSRSIVMGGSAILSTRPTSFKAQIRAAAARRLGCAPDEVELVDGKAAAPDGQSVSFAELAGEGIAADGEFCTNSRHLWLWRARRPCRGRSAHRPCRSRRLCRGRGCRPHHQPDDAARARSSARSCRGWAARCSSISSMTTQGQLLTGTLADYLLPTASDFPSIRAVTLEDEAVADQSAGRQGRGRRRHRSGRRRDRQRGRGGAFALKCRAARPAALPAAALAAHRGGAAKVGLNPAS